MGGVGNEKKVKRDKIAAIGIDFGRHIINFYIGNAGNKKGMTLDQDIRRSIDELKRDG